MGDKILVPLSIGYGRAVRELGELTANIKEFMRKPGDFKLVLFTGGEDVSPFMYDNQDSARCYYNIKRDLLESEIYEIALENEIKMAGICRGAQLLNVLAGGRMMRHINNHEGGFHYVETSTGDIIVVNSLHHQMIIPSDKTYVVGWSRYRLSDIYIGKDDKREEWAPKEVEAIIIPSTRSCGVQWHPEFMPTDEDGYKFHYNMVSDLLSMDMSAFTDKYVGIQRANGGT